MSQLKNIMSIQQDNPNHTILSRCYFLNSPVVTDICVDTTWTNVKLSISVDYDASNPYVFGARTSSTSTDKLEIRTNMSLSRFNTIIGGNSPAAYSYVTDITTRSDIAIDGTDITCTNSGTTTTVSVGSTPGFVACQYPICIGGVSNGGSPASLTMSGFFYGCEIYINNTLSHNIVPVKLKSDGSVVLYDTIANKYYPPVDGSYLYEDRPTYTLLDYCYFNSSPVDLGFALTSTITKFDISFTAGNSQWICGARDYQTSTERFTLQASSTTGISTSNVNSSSTVTISNTATRCDYSYDGNTVTIKNAGNTYTGANTRGFPDGNRNLVIGGIRNGSTVVTSSVLKGYFWGCSIYDAGTLTHNIVAAIDSLNIVCLYDTITNKAYYPVSGTLLAEAPSQTILDHCYFNDSPVGLDFPSLSSFTKVEISFSSLGASAMFFGAQANSSSAERFTIMASSTSIYTYRATSPVQNSISDSTKRCDYSYDGSNVTVVNDGNTYTKTFAKGFPNGAENLVIGGYRDGASIATSALTGYFYNCKIYQSGNLIHNIVPYKDGNNTIGLLDRYTGVTYSASRNSLSEEAPNA